MLKTMWGWVEDFLCMASIVVFAMFCALIAGG